MKPCEVQRRVFAMAPGPISLIFGRRNGEQFVTVKPAKHVSVAMREFIAANREALILSQWSKYRKECEK